MATTSDSPIKIALAGNAGIYDEEMMEDFGFTNDHWDFLTPEIEESLNDAGSQKAHNQYEYTNSSSEGEFRIPTRWRSDDPSVADPRRAIQELYMFAAVDAAHARIRE